MSIVRLHDHPALLKDCITLLNCEWKRSEMARYHFLKKSCDELPISFILIVESSGDGEPKVIGHIRLATVVEDYAGLLITSVLVDKDYRGHGHGKALMVHAEEFAIQNGYRTLYLSTHDKEKFYEHLGYSVCGGSGVTPCFLAAYKLKSFLRRADTTTGQRYAARKFPYDIKTLRNKVTTSNVPPPPPPPPQPPPTPSIDDIDDSKDEIWMKKELSKSD